jgi:hypothetical protein
MVIMESQPQVGTPSLGVNLGYNPFRPARRTRPAPREDEPRMDGFGEDGSYSVANDFAKIAGQALADYEARVNYERQKRLSIDSRGIVNAEAVPQDTSDRIYRETIFPVQQMFGGGGAGYARTQPPVIREIGDSIFERDPATGQWAVKVNGPAKPAPVQKFPGPTGLDSTTLQPSGVKSYSATDWLNLGPSLPDVIRTNPPVSNYIDWGRQSNAVPLNVTAGVTNQPARQPIKILSIRQK